jgi:hypothetical protein
MEAKGWTNKFFSTWFANIDNFRRVHDKKYDLVRASPASITRMAISMNKGIYWSM